MEDEKLETPIKTITSNWPETASASFDFSNAKIDLIFDKYPYLNKINHFYFRMKANFPPDENFNLKVTLEFINKDPTKNVTKTAIVKFAKNHQIAYFSVDFPGNEVDNEHGWLNDGKFSMNASFCLDESQDTSSSDDTDSDTDSNKNGTLSSNSSSSSESSDSGDNEESFEEYWLIENYTKKVGDFKSPIYNIESNKIHLETSRCESDKIDKTPFTVEIHVDEISGKYKIKATVTLMNQDQKSNLKFEKEVELSKKGDKITAAFANLMQSQITEQNGFVNNNQVMIIVRLTSADENNRVQLTSNNLSSAYSPYQHNYNYTNYNYNNRTYSYKDTSKENTGYVGLLNQGATCYMNSMLQSLFHTPAFRKLIYQIPTTIDENEETNVILNLQRLFGQLQFSDKACSTKALTQSFGWNTRRTATQHDTQEFARVLIDNIKEKIKNDENLKDGINNLLQIELQQYIRCKNVDFQKLRTEYLLDLMMTVKNCPTLEDSFKKYIEKEELIGDNQYDTDNPAFGKQDAEMGFEFLSFPPILHLHLGRFEYDYDYDRNIKINDRFEFPKEIDLEPYLAKEADRSKPSIYDLHGVLVHSGTVSYGHYFAFLRTSTDPQWYKFDDSVVTKVTEEQAINENFGGQKMKSFSAYFLVYVRRCDAEKIFEPISNDIVPEHIQEFVKHPTMTTSSSATMTSKATFDSNHAGPAKVSSMSSLSSKNANSNKSESASKKEFDIDTVEVNGIKIETLPHYQMETEEENKQDQGSKEESEKVNVVAKKKSELMPLILFNYSDQKVPVALVKARTDANPKELIQFISEKLNLKYDSKNDTIFLYNKDFAGDYAQMSPMTFYNYSTVKTVVSITYNAENIHYVFYRYLPGIKASDLSQKLLLNVRISLDGCSYVNTVDVIVPQTAKGYEIVDAIFQKIDFDELKIDKESLLSKDEKSEKYKNVRLMQMRGSKVVKIVKLNITLGAYYKEYRLDIVPEGQRNLADDEMIVLSSTASVKSNNQPLIYGIPFFMKLKKDLTIEQVKLIMKDKLNIEEKEFPKLKLFAGGGDYVMMVPKNEFTNDKVLGKLELKSGIYVVKNMHRVADSRSRRSEEALKIDN